MRKISKISGSTWFSLHQPLLLMIANTNVGRDFLMLDKNGLTVMELAPNRCTYKLGDKLMSDFRTRNKWGNLIRYRWKEFKKLAKSFYETEYKGGLILRPLLRLNGDLVSANTTSTFYPDPDPEVNTVDGVVARNATASFLTLRDGVGTVSDDGLTNTTYACYIWASSSSPNFSRISRSIYLFDTSSIGTDSVFSAYFAPYIRTQTLDFTVNSFGIATDLTSPASNTALQNSDYGSFSSVAQSDVTATGDIVTSSYNNLDFNSTGISNINTSGISKFGLREANYDLANTTPTWEASKTFKLDIYFADQTGTTNDPKLVVVHGVAVSENTTKKYYNYYQ